MYTYERSTLKFHAARCRVANNRDNTLGKKCTIIIVDLPKLRNTRSARVTVLYTARAAVATGTWVKSKRDRCLIRGSVGA